MKREKTKTKTDSSWQTLLYIYLSLSLSPDDFFTIKGHEKRPLIASVAPKKLASACTSNVQAEARFLMAREVLPFFNTLDSS